MAIAKAFFLYLLKTCMESTFICTSITKTQSGYDVNFNKTEMIVEPVTAIKGPIVIEQKQIIIKVTASDKDFYKQGEKYVFNLFNNKAK